MTIYELKKDMMRANSMPLFKQHFATLREHCHAEREPYYEVWLSAKDGLPRYLLEDRFAITERKGVIKIIDLKTSEVYEHQYSEKDANDNG